ncbi:Rodlet protein [Cladobotryum mycophilum]|uniref:Hydrophobin n=1 Tax=Cladobotryum mycophilum TaxID=491253 RepID=A0ABR0SXT5_9HYPO
MMFLATIAITIASVAAAPNVQSYPSSGGPPFDGITVGQAIDACGNNLKLECCNDVDKSVDIDHNAAVFGGLIGSLGGLLDHSHLGIFDQCSTLSVTALIGVDSLLNNHCKQNVACCQDSPSTAAGGLVNAGLPCVALGGVLLALSEIELVRELCLQGSS